MHVGDRTPLPCSCKAKVLISFEVFNDATLVILRFTVFERSVSRWERKRLSIACKTII
jgi:hypothetical protein